MYFTIEKTRATVSKPAWLNWMALAAAVFAFGYHLQASVVKTQLHRGYDFPVFYHAARALRGTPAQRLQAVSLLGLPPLILWIVTPLTPLPLITAIRVWHWMDVGFLVIAGILVYRLLKDGSATDPSKPAWALLGAVLLSLDFLTVNLKDGQTNILLLALLLAGVWLDRRGRQYAAGGVLGLVAALKLTPLLWGLYFLARRRCRVAAAMAAMFLVVAGILPELLVGRGADAAYLHHMGRIATRQANAQPVDERANTYGLFYLYLHSGNRSLLGLMERTLSHVNASWPGAAPRYVNVINLPDGTVRLLWMGLACAWIAGLLLWTWRDRDGRAWQAQTAFLMVTMLLLSPLTETHHFALLLWPWAVVIQVWLARRSQGQSDAVFNCLLAATVLLALLNAIRALAPYSLLTYYLLTLVASLAWPGRGEPITTERRERQGDRVTR